MKATHFSEIEIGSSSPINFLVVELNGKVDSKGHDFVDISASDGSATCTLKLWNRSVEASGLAVGDVVSATVEAKEYRGAPSYTLCHPYSKKEGADPSDFIPGPPVSQEDMTEWVRGRVSDMAEPYRSIAGKVLGENWEAYTTTAGGKSIHHAYRGGLLYHSYRMARAADALSLIYGYNRDLAVCGCLLHDIGKTKELSTDWLGNTDYTFQGQLEGHLLIGVRMIEAAATELGVGDGEPVRMLSHIVASHHGSGENGALHAPMTREAMLVHELDMIDMQQEICDTSSAIGAGHVTPYEVFGLGHKLYVPAL